MTKYIERHRIRAVKFGNGVHIILPKEALGKVCTVLYEVKLRELEE
jgi:putative transposon-encoded protein